MKASRLAVACAFATSCRFDPAYRDVVLPAPNACGQDGVVECRGTALARCVEKTWTPFDDCAARGLVCAPGLLRCTPCVPFELSCEGLDVVRCDEGGQQRSPVSTCESEKGDACRSGRCVNLCELASVEQSNVGCEYWAVDLDNAVTGQGSAAAQQFAVLVSNAQPDLAADVIVDEDVAAVGAPAEIRTVGTARVGPRSLEVFRLGPKEVDGSAPGTFDTGTHTALSRGAFRIRSDVPIVAYQFNPLENVSVFSNEAALLLPTDALGGGQGRSYVVAGWPQTIARSQDPEQDFGLDLRAFLTFVGTKPDTRVRVSPSARIVAGGPFAAGVAKGEPFDVVLQPFEVLNLETGDFNADFTGTLVDSSEPLAVFVGSEASDAPFVPTLASRQCCADHLEEQVFPLRTVGKRYVLGRVPNRTRAIAAAGAAISYFEEPEFYRVVATQPGKTTVKTSLPAPYAAFELPDEGAERTLTVHSDFVLEASQAVLVADVQASQEAAGVVGRLPGGDPSLTFAVPYEQWQLDYVLLTPDKYVFDFLVVTAPAEAQVFLDGLPVDGTVCELAPIAQGFVVYRCQLSFPSIDPQKPAGANVSPGRQNDGVHHVQSDRPVGVLVYGFDAFVSYAYAGGTALRTVNVK